MPDLARINLNDRPRMGRREFVQALAAATAVLWAPGALASPVEAAMFLRPGDSLSDPERLRKKFDSLKLIPTDAPGSALRWRLMGDKWAARVAMSLLWPKVMANKLDVQSWVEATQLAMAIDWMATYPPFYAAAKAHAADVLLQTAERALKHSYLVDPERTSYVNTSVGLLTTATFTFTAAARLAPEDKRIADLRDRLGRTIRNILEQTQFVTPDGSYHESMDYFRIAFAPLTMLAELQRTLTGEDPAEKFTVFRNLGDTYLYKLLPDGTPSREGDNEFPLLQHRDNVVLGYAVHRFRDGRAARLLRSGDITEQWSVPVLRFLWDDADVRTSGPVGKAHAKHFHGVDQVVLLSGFSAGDTRIEFDCGPYFGVHQHLDRNHFTIHHRGHLAIDSGADYTTSVSPHNLNYYRRTVAHNSMLVFDPNEKFFWGDNNAWLANDGGQKLDSYRFWNNIRSVADWEKTKDIWDVGRMRAVDIDDPRYMYAMGDATRAYSPKKLSKFTRELLYLPKQDVLLVFDDVRSTREEFRKAWLLHTVEEPVFAGSGEGGSADTAGFGQVVRVAHDHGEMTVHTLLPVRRFVTKRGGPGKEFWTPGNSANGDWGTGRNWPLDAAEGGSLPDDPEESAMWRTMYGATFDRLQPSNRKNVIPGSWRVEVTPRDGALNDHFFHVFEIGDRGKTGNVNVEAIRSESVEGALCGTTAAIFLMQELGKEGVEFLLPNAQVDLMWLRGLPVGQECDVAINGRSVKVKANAQGVATLSGPIAKGGRVRLSA